VAQPKTRGRIVDALLALAAERPWPEVTLEALAERAGVTLGALRAAYDGRLAVFADFVRATDEKVLAGLDPDLVNEAPRERLFDVLFARLEQLKPHRQAIRNIGRAAARDPLLAAELNRIAVCSMGWMLAAAGISSTGGAGLLRSQGLALVWTRVLRVWLDDEDAGLARTMAELDKRLRQAERAAVRLDRLARVFRPPRKKRRRSGANGAGEAEAEAHPS
jgi:AcrR family transcriptional regulator